MIKHKNQGKKKRRHSQIIVEHNEDTVDKIFEEKKLKSTGEFIDNLNNITNKSQSSCNKYEDLLNMNCSKKSSNFSSIISTKNSNHISSLTGNPCGRKIEIKNFKVKDRIPENFEELQWGKLILAIHAIQEKRPIKIYTLEELYRCVQDMCLRKLSSNLYENLKKESTMHTKSYLQNFHNVECGGIEFLKMVERYWNDHCEQTNMIRRIFLYLDRTYVLQSSDIKSIWDLGVQLFGEYIMSDSMVQQRTVQGILACIQAERNGELIDKDLIKKLLRMMSVLQIYDKCFEPKFLLETKMLYAKESTDIMTHLELPEILTHIDRRLKEEYSRLNYYLDSSTSTELISTLENELIECNLKTLLVKGFSKLMSDNLTSDINLLYRLYGRVTGGHLELHKRFTEYVKDTGKNLVLTANKDEKIEKTLVQDIIDFKDELDNIIQNCFKENNKFVTCMKECFEYFVNFKNDYVAELVAKFLDSKLRASNKDFTENDLEMILDKILILFRFIGGKDMFEGFYKKDLAKRLLIGKSASLDAEKSMLSKLKSECGPAFTTKLEGMFKDIDVSKEIMTYFKQQVRNRDSNLKLEINCITLTKSYWPDYPKIDVVIPCEILELQKQYEDYYVKKYVGRKLEWQPFLGTCILKSKFKHETKELAVSMYQALVLLQFNDNDRCSFKELLENTKIEIEELKITLQSLACMSKLRILNKIPKGKEIDVADTFEYIADFKHKLFRIKINQIQMKETKKEHTETEEKVFQDRQYHVDACIVRIMKMRKKIPHNQLIAEIYDMLKFSIKPTELKLRIESLIDRDYLERDKTNNNQYIYMA